MSKLTHTIEIETKVFRADGSLKSAETVTTEITEDTYNKLKNGVI